MKVAVIGLRVEGKKTLKSLKDRGYQIYATDLDKKIALEDEGIDLDLGFHDEDKIFSADSVALSPGLWKTPLGEKVKESKMLLSDKINTHRSLFTIGVTGTNGKTTTSLMIKSILEKAGMEVLIGGNAGGGFDGYSELILEADSNKYQAMIVEVCDMTLEYAEHCFDFDLVVATNIGPDHLDHHQSLENYARTMGEFLKSKHCLLNKQDKYLVEISKNLVKYSFYDKTTYQLLLFGEFNKINAGAAETVANILKIREDIIKDSLENFNPVEGRIKAFDIKGSHIVVGKTDNTGAIQEVLKEAEFPVMVVGTPRAEEKWRFKILEEVCKSNPETIILFPGLEDSTSQAVKKLISLGFEGEVKIIKEFGQLPEIIKPYLSFKNIFIGGNGQEKIKEMQNYIESLSKG
ncbi:MAG: UDP-N-acetylmuramoyl-L-alanine--D-glutamate ligase [Euryarchaeota archaeon]|nr:UDP-N-acetylmuramoyl-L-alanine--D-glutamate ligase [Euryarchaeota archaeon]MBU4607378.1 UDP-N-acetylmuramoyl-L-alanine--D-glutamate ligase [Euryarchaeota archaeon]MBV1729820.1 UDP-N-acetylmuramoyl-L-alanine--D-glutamate ligase [Methanobacterium sp.]MBV1754699.1 UDP-N-acetylmuramoyl-L-alanine--D-glutamate ligase [Methanobacterium sp.]